MSDHKILKDWVDEDRVRTLAEGLLKQPEVAKINADDVVYSDDFVGFADEPSARETVEPPAPVSSKEAPEEPGPVATVSLEPVAEPTERLESKPAEPVEAPEPTPRFGEKAASLSAEIEAEAEAPAAEVVPESAVAVEGERTADAAPLVKAPIPLESPIPDPIITTQQVKPPTVAISPPIPAPSASPFEISEDVFSPEEKASLPRSV